MAGKTDSLDPKTTIEVPDDRFGLYSCDILDPDVVGNPITIPWPHNCPLLSFGTLSSNVVSVQQTYVCSLSMGSRMRVQKWSGRILNQFPT